jgi:hypothetical protein
MFVNFEGEFDVIRGGRLPRFHDAKRGDLAQWYERADYPALKKAGRVRMFTVAGHEHLGLVPEFILRGLKITVTDLSGQVSFSSVKAPPRDRGTSRQASVTMSLWSLLEGSEKRKALSALLDDLPDEI